MQDQLGRRVMKWWVTLVEEMVGVVDGEKERETIARDRYHSERRRYLTSAGSVAIESCLEVR